MKLATRIFRREDWYVTSPFGWRKDPINGKTAYHSGVDYGTHGNKWPQYALENGVVESCGIDVGGAIFAWVKYPRISIRLLHYHLDSLCVKKGWAVNKDTIIGYTGTTGRSTGIHLHLGMTLMGRVDKLDAHAYDYIEVPVETKTIEQLAKEVLEGNWGNGVDRKNRLTAAGYNYSDVQRRVNELVSDKIEIYIVKKGDTLSKIGKKYNIRWEKIYNDNKNVIGRDPNKINIGQRLVIKK